MTFAMKDGSVPVSNNFGNGNGNGHSPHSPSENTEMNPDPPRVWVKGHNFPGCSYTRSLGDR